MKSFRIAETKAARGRHAVARLIGSQDQCVNLGVSMPGEKGVGVLLTRAQAYEFAQQLLTMLDASAQPVPEQLVSGSALDKLAALYGVSRAAGEPDDVVRSRALSVVQQVQAPAVLDLRQAVDSGRLPGGEWVIRAQASITVCPPGDCPCGRVRAGCEYHDPTLQPVDPVAASR